MASVYTSLTFVGGTAFLLILLAAAASGTAPARDGNAKHNRGRFASGQQLNFPRRGPGHLPGREHGFAAFPAARIGAFDADNFMKATAVSNFSVYNGELAASCAVLHDVAGY